MASLRMAQHGVGQTYADLWKGINEVDESCDHSAFLERLCAKYGLYFNIEDIR